MAGLQDYTKTLLFGGPSDEIPDFLQEAPSTAYVQNGRYNQKDAISKALPYERLTNSGLFTGQYDLLSIGERKGQVVALRYDGAVHEWADGDASWSTTTSRCIPTTNERTLRQYAPASRQCDFATNADGDTFMVWNEVEIQAGTDLPIADLRYALYNAAGRKVDAGIVNAGAYCPRVIAKSDGDFIVFYIGGTGDILRKTYDTSAETLSAFTIVVPDVARNLPWVADAITDFPPGSIPGHPLLDGNVQPAWRTGFMTDGGNTGYFDVAYNSDQTEGVILFCKDPGGTVQYQRLFPSGNAQGLSVSVVTALDPIYDEKGIPLAVHIDNDGYVGALVWGHDTLTNNSTVRFRITNDSDVTVQTHEYPSTDQLPINGTVAPVNLFTAGEFYIAWTKGPQLVPWLMRQNTTTNPPQVACYRATPVSDTLVGVYNHQRLASKGVYDSFGDVTHGAGLTVVLQQYLGATDPYAEGDGTGHQVSAPVGNKSTTSVLARLYDFTYSIISTYDAAQSRATVGSGLEQDIFLTTLEYDSDTEWRYCNRVNIEPEDIGFRNTMVEAANQTKRKCVLSPGAAEYRVYKTKTNQAVEAQPFGDLVLFNTGCPLVWDGIELREAFMFDAPEPLWYRASDREPNHIQFEVTHAKIHEWRKMQLIYGYVDATETLHRTAPSIPIWVEGLEAGSSNSAGGFVQIPRPFTAGSRSFVEVHVGVGTSPPQLAKVEYIGTGSGAREIYFTDRTVAAGPGTNTTEVIRSSRTLYTEGGVLAADAMPSFTDYTIGANRLFATDGGSLVYFTKVFEPNIFPEFNGTFVVDLGRNREITAVETLDEKTIAFTRDEIFVLSNTGPDNTGANGDFFVDRMQTPVGCANPQSVAATPDGIVFFSDQTKTFYLITRDLQLIEIGLAVSQVSQDVTSLVGAITYAAEKEVRFYAIGVPGDADGETPNTDAGVPARPPTPKFKNNMPATHACFVFNYEYKRWSINTLPEEPKRVTMVGDVPAYLTGAAAPRMYIQRSWGSDVAAELDTDQALKVTLPWSRSQTLQSFGRVDEVVLLGRYLSSWTKDASGNLAAGDVKVNFYYDYDSLTVGDSYLFRANAGQLGHNRMQVTAKPGQPKTQAIKVEIVEVASTKIQVSEPSYRLGRGFTLDGLDIRYSPKRGLGNKTQPVKAIK